MDIPHTLSCTLEGSQASTIVKKYLRKIFYFKTIFQDNIIACGASRQQFVILWEI
jgi:hypothetical protein